MSKDKVALLMEETGCDRSEAELALQLCAYDVESSVQAVPRLFQHVVIFKARVREPAQSLYGLWLAILNLKERRLLRARAVVSYNPAVFASELDIHWFDFEARLYACRLWAGTAQDLSQDLEAALAAFFDSAEARPFYEEGRRFGSEAFAPVRAAMGRVLGAGVELEARQDVLDLGEFREVRPTEPYGEEVPPPRPWKRPRRAARGGLLVLHIAIEPDPAGVAAEELKAGDLVYASINDQRDIAQYLAKLFGGGGEKGAGPVVAPIEAVERTEGRVALRVRFSAGVCGDVDLPGALRVRTARRPARSPWWKRFIG
ncbi:MAG: hypothetical protein HY928_15715 [Elusimicrobia bacterium]|nr:hypothetical protein [Elusimicrobiota bacterium]